MQLKHSLFYLIAILLFISALGTSYESNIRYLKYAIFPVSTLFLMQHRKIVINKVLLQNLILYLLLIGGNIVVSLFTGQTSARFFEESMLILLPILTVFIITASRNLELDKLIEVLFFAYLFAFIIFFWRELINLPTLILKFKEALTLSYYPTESWMAFPFGLFAQYFFIEKRYRWFLIALAIFLLSFKRIAMIASLFSVIVYYLSLLTNLHFKRLQIVKILTLLNAVLLIIVYFFINGFFTKLIYRYTGVTINHFSQGRFHVYNDVIKNFSENLLTGNGLGFTHNYLSIKYPGFAHLHSDILKIILEFGIVFFLVWLLSFIYINVKNFKALAVLLYLNILFLTDNVFIYFDTLFIFYLIIAKYDKHSEVKT